MVGFQPSCWSENGELEVVMMCAPSKLDVPSSTIAENVQWDGPVQQAKAQESFLGFKDTLERAGVKVIDYSQELPQEARPLSDQLINRYFVRDLACVFGEVIIPGEAGISLRRPEYPHAQSLLEKWFPEQFVPNDTNIGEALEFGDVMVLNKDAVFINIGTRTSMKGVEKAKEAIYKAGFSEIAIIALPRSTDTLHLDMNCNVAANNVIIAKDFMRFFPVKVLTEKGFSFDMMESFLNRHGFNLHWLEKYKTIPDINFLNVDPETLLISKQANKQNFKQHPLLQNKRLLEVDVKELEKGGGGIRCMTLPLRRKK